MTQVKTATLAYYTLNDDPKNIKVKTFVAPVSTSDGDVGKRAMVELEEEVGKFMIVGLKIEINEVK